MVTGASRRYRSAAATTRGRSRRASAAESSWAPAGAAARIETRTAPHTRISREPGDEPTRGPQIDLERVLPAQRTGHDPQRGEVLRLVAYQQRLVPAVPEKRERDIDRARRRAICDDQKPPPAAPPRQRRELADLAEGQDARLVPHRGNALDEVHRGVVQDRPRVSAVHQQRR